MQYAVSWVGVCPYVYGGNNLSAGGGVDCSGFTQQVFKHFGISLNRSSSAQYNNGTRISKSELRPGDLVFFGRSGISHVAIYIGNGQIVHASTAKTGIKISNLNQHSQYNPYIGAVRVLD